SLTHPNPPSLKLRKGSPSLILREGAKFVISDITNLARQKAILVLSYSCELADKQFPYSYRSASMGDFSAAFLAGPPATPFK
ncbi:hypothetical protein KJ590_01205, partial [Patescibacteria group bacterium]|nr:hypothetical protein [Patescibacteria group bacterium]